MSTEGERASGRERVCRCGEEVAVGRVCDQGGRGCVYVYRVYECVWGERRVELQQHLCLLFMAIQCMLWTAQI